MSDVTLSLWGKAPYVFINGELPERVVNALDDELSYEIEDAKRTHAYKNSSNPFDGKDHLLREAPSGGHYFPVGVLSRATDILRAFNVDYETEKFHYPGPGDLDLEWNSGMELRDYQQEAVEAALRSGSGLVVLPTGAGKTVVGLELMRRIRRPAVIFCHLEKIAEQWVERIRDILGYEPAICYGGKAESGDIQVCLYQTIYQDGEVRDDIRLDHDVLIPDEAHRVAASTFQAVTMDCTATYRWGFTATPERGDNAKLRMIGGVGPIIYEKEPEELIRRGYLAEPVFDIPKAPRTGGYYDGWQDEYRGEIVENHRRNKKVAKKAEELPIAVLVSVEYIDHGEILEGMIDGGRFIHSDHPEKDETLDAFKAGEVPILIATRGLIGEGFDAPVITSLIVAGGLKSPVVTLQQVGRALRPETEKVHIVDFNDPGIWISDHAEQRIRTYRDYYGEFGP